MDNQNTNKNILKSNIKYHIGRDLNSLVGKIFFFFLKIEVSWQNYEIKRKVLLVPKKSGFTSRST